MAIPRFWREVGSRYRLVGSKCGNCGRVQFPRRSFCPICHRFSIGKMEDMRFTGNGTVVSFSIVHQTIPSLEDLVPYVVAVVKLEEGIRVTSQIVGIDPGKVTMGMPVKVAFRKLGEDGPSGVIYYGYKFVPRVDDQVAPDENTLMTD